jgi:hypothetical protein
MEFVLNKLPRGQGEKIRWSQLKRWADKCACAQFIRLPPLLPADFKEQAGRTQGFHNCVCDLSVADHVG